MHIDHSENTVILLKKNNYFFFLKKKIKYIIKKKKLFLIFKSQNLPTCGSQIFYLFNNILSNKSF